MKKFFLAFVMLINHVNPMSDYEKEEYKTAKMIGLLALKADHYRRDEGEKNLLYALAFDDFYEACRDNLVIGVNGPTKIILEKLGLVENGYFKNDARQIGKAILDN